LTVCVFYYILDRMNDAKPWFEEIVIPALLRHARTTYGMAMRKALADAGYDDVPRNGMYVIGGMALGGKTLPLGVLIKELGVSKQGAGQLVDTLVLRGYLERTEDPEDRRKLNIVLTKRGRAAAAVQAAAREKIDAELIARVGQENVLRTRRTLAALIDMGRAAAEEQNDEH
jgi:DNA-binding MarR family transcriptional regulator